MAPRRLLLFVCLGWMLAAPTVLAADGPVHASLDVRGPIRLEGITQATAQDGTVLVVPPASGNAFAVADAHGTLRIVHVSRQAVVNPLGGGNVWLTPEYSDTYRALDGAALRVADARPDFLSLLTPTGDGTVGIGLPEGGRNIDSAADALDFVIGVRDPDPYYFAHEVPANSFLLHCDMVGADVGVTGQVRLVLNGATLQVDGPDGIQTWVLGDQETPATELLGAQATAQHESTYAVLVLQDPAFQLEPGATVQFYSRAPVIALDGTLRLASTEGSIAIPGAVSDTRGSAVELTGQLLVRLTRLDGTSGVLRSSDDRTRLEVEGSASRVAVGGQPLLATLAPDASSAVAPAIGLVALLVAWFSGAGTKVLAMALSPAFAGVTPRVLLENDRRRQIYQAVLGQPGVHMRELQRLTGMRWGSLQYHVAVMVGLGLLRSAQAGRRTLLACDAHGLEPEQIRALHLLRGMRARRVADAVSGATGVTQRDLVTLAQVSPRLASRYLTLMAQLGLVQALEGRPKRYYPTQRMAELLPRAGHGSPHNGAAMAPVQ